MLCKGYLCPLLRLRALFALDADGLWLSDFAETGVFEAFAFGGTGRIRHFSP